VFDRLWRTPHARRKAVWLLTILVLIVGITIPGSLKAEIEGHLWSSLPWSASAHFVLFAIIAAIPVYGEDRWRTVRALLLAIALATLTELLQQSVPGRHALLRDGLIDLAGAMTGIAIGEAQRKLKGPRKRGP
jgi:hypothetical protein